MNKDKVFIIAEMSANHNGSIETAIETIKAAKRAGADAIKLQTYTADTMTLNVDKEGFVLTDTIWKGKNLYKLYNEAHTPWEWHKKLFEEAKKENIICFSSPFDKSAVDFLEKLNCPIYKIASFEITDIPLIEYIAKKNKPIILSTGIANYDDIKLALDTIRSTGNNNITLLKCTSSYPAPIEEANLIMMKQFKKDFDVKIGLSDHTLGITLPIVATVLGAKVIEKHFILDKTMGGIDSSFSLDEKEFTKMVKAVREAKKSIGNINYNLTEKQKEGRKYSRSLYISENVKKGDVVNEKNIKSIRPGYGMHPKHYKSIIGKKFQQDLEKGTPLTKKMIGC